MFDFQPPQILHLDREWSVGEHVGSGGFGRVYVIESNGVAPHVAKFIPKEPGADRELLFSKLSDIPNVVPVVDTGEWEDYWIIVMPKAEMSVANLLSKAEGTVSTVQATSILLDVAQALISMKKNHVVHRDIKPENILFLDGRWHLADFGISRYAEAATATYTRKFVWTDPYAAPEQWRGETATNATDVYAFGIVAYYLLAGFLPFVGPDYRKQHLESTPPPIPDTTPAMTSLINACLMKAPEARPNPEAILERLEQTHKPQTKAARKLQEANSRAVRQRAERASIKSAYQSEQERKRLLKEAAEKAFNRIVKMLYDKIRIYAPDSVEGGRKTTKWQLQLENATLSVAYLSHADVVFSSRGDIEWEVLAYSYIKLDTPPDQHGHEGRAHSLWYLRQDEEATYRWHELAFKDHAYISKRNILNPFALSPEDGNAQQAIAAGTHSVVLERPPVPIDQGQEEQFIEQWIELFAEAVTAE